MRYLLQLLIPALILIGLVYAVMRNRGSRTHGDEPVRERDGDKGTFILILVIGALVAVGVVFALQGFWGGGA